LGELLSLHGGGIARETQEVSNARRKPVRLAGTHEAAAILGISKSSVHDRARSDPDFPAPLARLACGTIWDADELKAYEKAYDRTYNWFRGRRHHYE
jgi:hypothetical protein